MDQMETNWMRGMVYRIRETMTEAFSRSDAGGFDSPQPLDISWPPETPADAFNGGMDIPNKISAVTPGVGTRNRFVDHTRLARSL